MKGRTPLLLLGALLFTVRMEGGQRYNFTYLIKGNASSKILLFFPFRVSFEMSASVNFSSERKGRDTMAFTFADLPQAAYLVRTLGFSGHELAILAVDYDTDRALRFAEKKYPEWQKDTPAYAARIKKVKKFPHRLTDVGGQGLVFERDSTGVQRNCRSGLGVKYRYYPSKHNLYFNVFPIAAEMLALYDHPVLPPGADLGKLAAGAMAAEWDSPWLDYSGALNRIGAWMEKVVKSLVTVEQRWKFRLHYRIDRFVFPEIDICGEAHPDVTIWKSYMIRDMVRRLRFRLPGNVLVQDDIWISLRNGKGQGGDAYLSLRLVE